MRNKWKKRSGEGYIDTCVLILCAMLVIALAVKVLPVYVAKQQLDTFAAELVREAEITGRVGSETTSRAQVYDFYQQTLRIRIIYPSALQLLLRSPRSSSPCLRRSRNERTS